MSNTISFFCESVLAILIFYNLGSAYFSKDKVRIWSPMSVISLTFIYYCLVPFWLGTKEQYVIDESMHNGYLFHLAALLSYVSIMMGFKYSKTKQRFLKWSKSLTAENVGKIGIFITIIGLVGYASVRGFHLTMAYSGNELSQMSIGGLTYYAMMMLDMLPFASAMLLVGLKDNKKNVWFLVLFWLIMVQFLIAGARWRIVVAMIALLTTYHSYPKVKKINVPILASLAVVVYLGFSAMDMVRVRGGGINMAEASKLNYNDIKQGSNENYDVYWFSLMSIEKITATDQHTYFTPILTAVLMPIPRSVFPWKPDAQYILDLESSVGAYGGSAYLNFVEAYFAFGWIGVALFGWFLGWLARVFWDFYDRNRQSRASIIGLGVFSGFCYVMVSRGYLAASFTSIILAIYVPFWIIQLCNKFVKK